MSTLAPPFGNLWAKRLLVALVLHSVLAPWARANLTEGLLGYWPLDGDGADASGNDRPLDIIGGAEFSKGLLGQGLHLHGDRSQYAVRPVVDDAFNFGASDFSIQVWINVDSYSDQTIIEQFDGAVGPGWTVHLFNSETLHFYADQASLVLNSPLQDLALGAWGQVVVRREQDTIQEFFNGEPIGSTVYSPSIMPSSLPLLVGRRNGAQGLPFSGAIDEVAIWNRALGDEEVVQLYNDGQGLSLQSATPGDANGDGNVDLDDFGILKAHFGSGSTRGEGDFDGDGQVDLADFGILKANFGKNGAAGVPEPAAGLLALLAAFGFVVRKATLTLLPRHATIAKDANIRKWALSATRPSYRKGDRRRRIAGAAPRFQTRNEIATTMWRVGVAVALALVAFHPRIVPSAEPLFWFDATDTSTVLDSADHSGNGATEPFLVAAWKDRSSNGIDAAQLDEDNQPLFVPEGINGLPSLEFDGSDDFFELLPTLEFHDQMSIFTVVQLYAIDPGRREGILSGVTQDGHAAEMWLGGDDGPLLGQTFVSRVYPKTFDDVAGVPMVIGVTYDGAEATFSMNGTAESLPYDLQEGEWAPDQYIVGRSPFASATLNGMMSELLVYDTALDRGARAQVESRLLSKYGLASALAGDANSDGTVDLTDFGILKNNFGSGSSVAEGDFDGDGQVDLSDFGILKANFGKSAAAAVPEPSGPCLLAFGVLALGCMRRLSLSPVCLLGRTGWRRGLTGSVLCALAAWLVVLAPAQAADVLFYNGDQTGGPEAWLNQKDFNGPDRYRYTQFTVPPGQSWQVSGLFANTVYNLDNNFPQNAPTNSHAYYEIRSGVSPGNGGTLIASGSVAALPTAMGFSFAGYDGFRIEGALSTVVLLGPGTYWESFTPIGSHDELAFIYQTNGANAINVDPLQQTYFSESGTTEFDPVAANVSMGVLGTVVPEPTGAALFAGGLLCLGAHCLRRAECRRPSQ